MIYLHGTSAIPDLAFVYTRHAFRYSYEKHYYTYSRAVRARIIAAAATQGPPFHSWYDFISIIIIIELMGGGSVFAHTYLHNIIYIVKSNIH